jgi:hypothetical protein
VRAIAPAHGAPLPDSGLVVEVAFSLIAADAMDATGPDHRTPSV